MAEKNQFVMTREGYEKLQEELKYQSETHRAEVAEKIRVARGFGDLSENAEYEEAKNEQAFMEGRIPGAMTKGLLARKAMTTVPMALAMQVARNTPFHSGVPTAKLVSRLGFRAMM